MFIKVKHYIGNIFHIKSWSDNYKRNNSFESFIDAYYYVIYTHNYLYNLLEKYYKNRNIVCHLIKYNCKNKPRVEITRSRYAVPYKMMSYDKSTLTIYIHPNMLYKDPIEFRSLLVHELIHHVYSSINLSYGLFRKIFQYRAKSKYEKDPEEFIADYWRLCYKGYLRDDIIKQLANWYINDDKDYTTTNRIVTLMEDCGYIPIVNSPIQANCGLNKTF